MKQYDRETLAFLPAALEVRDTPPSPVGRAILWTVMLLFTATVVWAALGKTDIVAVAQGKIIPTGRVKIIQPLETGVVKRILVEEGQAVAAEQVLLELDTTASGADVERLREEILMARLDEARLDALLLSVQQNHLQTMRAVAEAEDTQNRLHQTRLEKQFGEYQSRLAALQDEIRKSRAERAAAEARVAQLQATLPLITERAQALKDMADKQLGPKVQWLELEQERIEQLKALDVQRHQQQVIDAAIAGLKQQQQLLAVQTEAQYLGELAEVRRRLSGLRQELVKAEQRQTLQYLRAPTAGQVQQLAMHTVGGVVTPAQQLMVIVPESQTLEVEAWVQNKDIGFIESGQEAAVKVEAFPFTKYGTIGAEVMALSQDAVAVEDAGLVYTAKVALQANRIRVNKRWVRLSPGMSVTVEIKTGKRRLLEYFLSPLLRYRQESVRER